MTDTPVSPKAGRLATPGWLDGRLVLGVLLVLVSVVVGARVLSSADRSQLVWTAARDLAPGTSLSADDLERTQVRLFTTTERYLSAAGAVPTGYVLERPVGRGELVPLDALQRPGGDVDLRFVAVPVLPGHYPPSLAKGQQVDVWATPDRGAGQSASPPAEGAADAGAPPAGSRLVLAGVTVDAPPDSGGGLGGGTAERAVVLSVRAGDVGALVSAMSQGRIDLVRVPGPRDARAELAPGVEGR